MMNSANRKQVTNAPGARVQGSGTWFACVGMRVIGSRFVSSRFISSLSPVLTGGISTQ
jgi:hypothetical protein